MFEVSSACYLLCLINTKKKAVVRPHFPRSLQYWIYFLLANYKYEEMLGETIHLTFNNTYIVNLCFI